MTVSARGQCSHLETRSTLTAGLRHPGYLKFAKVAMLVGDIRQGERVLRRPSWIRPRQHRLGPQLPTGNLLLKCRLLNCGYSPNGPPPPRKRSTPPTMELQQGQFVEVRGRPWLVEAVDDREPSLTTLRLSCIADDAQGEQIEVLWDAEIGAKIIQDDTWSQVGRGAPDSPEVLAAYLRAIRWRSATAADRGLLRSTIALQTRNNSAGGDLS
jgi:hypothetical protein